MDLNEEEPPAKPREPRDPREPPPLIERPDIIPIAPRGGLVLNVTFETSSETLKAARKAFSPGRPGRPRQDGAAYGAASSQLKPLQKPRLRQGFRVDLAVLKKHSKFFSVLLGEDSRFQEAQSLAAAFKAMALRNVKPADVTDPAELPSVEITDDDEATRSALRQHVFADFLRILHGKQTSTRPVTMQYVATLAVLADRFDCPSPVSRWLASDAKFKWPVAKMKTPSGYDDGSGPASLANEGAIRQKILAAWLLDQPLKLHAATRELIMLGSSRWSAFAEPVEDADGSLAASWWDLQDDLENELRCRRESILNTIASVQQHFLSLYSSRAQLCKLGYDSSMACDSYQLGQMVKFLANKKLLFLVDFSPASLDTVEDFSKTDISHILATLKQCPSYQIDKNHMNCGLRTKMMPILEYIQAMTSSNVISISRATWKNNRREASWVRSDGRDEDGGRPFRFTRGVAGDQRLRYEGAMAADRMARELFTATSWDWTPEE